MDNKIRYGVVDVEKCVSVRVSGYMNDQDKEVERFLRNLEHYINSNNHQIARDFGLTVRVLFQ